MEEIEDDVMEIEDIVFNVPAKKQHSLKDLQKAAKDRASRKKAVLETKKDKETLREIAKVAGDAKNIIEEDILEVLDDEYANLIKNKKRIFIPDDGLQEMSPERCPGPQTRFLEADEYEVLASGARGGGKSTVLIVDALRYVHRKKFKGLVIRRTMPELRELISKAKDIYHQAFPGSVKWKEQEKMFTFPSGATIEFGYCDNLDDALRYQGQEYTWLGIDEVTQYPTDEILEKISKSLRTTDPELKCYIRLTSNPSGPGVRWVKERFLEDKEGKPVPPDRTAFFHYDTPLGPMTVTRKWIHSTTMDNPTLLKANPQYLATLASIKNEALRKQWLEGSWDAVEGLAFNEFNENIHVVEPFDIPKNWYRFRAADWGYSSKAACLWFAVSPDNDVYVYRELLTTRVLADEFARRVLELEEYERVSYGVLDGSTWAERGQIGETPADTMLNMGCFWTPADRKQGSRVAGKQLIHSYLRVDEWTDEPKLKIFSTCKNLIKELGNLILDEKNPEDVDTKQEDHLYDALRYGILSLPNLYNTYEPFDSRHEQPPILVDVTFGY